MDALLPAVLGAFPQLGPAGLLVFLIVLLIRREGTTLDRERAAYAAELTRISLAHDAEQAERKTEIAELRAQVAALNEALDSERGRRRAAEDSGRHRADRTEQEGRSPWAG